MSDFQETNMETTMSNNISLSPAADTAEEKVYVEPNPAKGKRYSNMDDLLNGLCSPEDAAEVKAIAATQTVGHALTSMRIAAGISQKMMAAALGVTQPRISMIESAPNSKASWSVIIKYVEVTQRPFKAVLEDGCTVSFTKPVHPRRRPGSQKKTPACA